MQGIKCRRLWAKSFSRLALISSEYNIGLAVANLLSYSHSFPP